MTGPHIVVAQGKPYRFESYDGDSSVAVFLIDPGGEQVEDAYAEVEFGNLNPHLDDGVPKVFRGAKLGYVTGIELPDELQGRGIGTAMMESLEKLARGRGVETLLLHPIGIPDPTRFYLGLGYEPVSPLAGQSLPLYAKRL